MNSYHKIQGLYKRYIEGENRGKFIIGQYSRPEFELLKNITWQWTEKIDGTNIRCLWYSDPLLEKLTFKGRTDKADMPKHLLIKLQKIIKKDKMIEIFGLGENISDVCLYGEGYGYKIQSGCKYFGGKKEVGFILFDIKIGHIWLKRKNVVEIAGQLGIPVVPYIGEGIIEKAIKLVKNGFQSTFGNFVAEGLIIKPKIELNDRMGRCIITKIKHIDFKGV